MSYIGSKPANKPVVASDLDPTVITGQTALATSPADTDEFLISDAGVLKRLDASLIGGNNTPAFFAKLGSHQTISDATSTKITFNTEVYDSGNVYDNSSNYRFTPAVAGKYYVFAGLSLYGTAAFTVMDSYLDLYKNGSVYAREHHYEHDGSPNGSASFYMGRILDLDDNDYIEFFNFTDVTSGSPQIQGGTGTSNATYFGAYKIII